MPIDSLITNLAETAYVVSSFLIHDLVSRFNSLLVSTPGLLDRAYGGCESQILPRFAMMC